MSYLTSAMLPYRKEPGKVGTLTFVETPVPLKQPLRHARLNGGLRLNVRVVPGGDPADLCDSDPV